MGSAVTGWSAQKALLRRSHPTKDITSVNVTVCSPQDKVKVSKIRSKYLHSSWNTESSQCWCYYVVLIVGISLRGQ
jgi:hypothetical protein